MANVCAIVLALTEHPGRLHRAAKLCVNPVPSSLCSWRKHFAKVQLVTLDMLCSNMLELTAEKTQPGAQGSRSTLIHAHAIAGKASNLSCV
jgi:hypothetical protein